MMDGQPNRASGRQNPLPQRIPSCRMPTTAAEARKVPVTPGISFGTYNESPIDTRQPSTATGYFTSSGHTSSSDLDYSTSELSLLDGFGQENVHDKKEVPIEKLKGTVISATFTLPQIIQLDKNETWKITHRGHCSAHLDSLAYLSSEDCCWSHTVVAWTGEINESTCDQSSNRSSQHQRTLESTSLPVTAQVKNGMKTGDFCLSNSDQEILAKMLQNDSIKTVPVWLGDKEEITAQGITLRNQSRWRSFAEHDLCSLFHYNQQSLGHGWAAESRWRDFERMNELFADKICELHNEGDVVVVNDYYLMLLPAILRKRCPGMRIIMTLEAPFPTSELVRCLKPRAELLNGMLGADLLCFEAYHYAQHFANSCARILQLDVSRKWVDATEFHRTHLQVCPSGINSSKVTSLAFADVVDEKYTQLAKIYAGKKIIIGCDPMDRLSGVDKKLEAFKYFLDNHPEWRDKVVLIQFAGHTTVEADDDENAKYTWRVQDLATTINSSHGSVGSLPVQIHAEQLSQEDYYAILRLGDVAVHTCIREGMSTTGLEYIACQRQKHGVLIISEFSGTASSLDEAIHVNPWDTADVAHQIHKALSMPMDERRTMHQSLSNRLEDTHVKYQTNKMLERLIEVLGDNQHSTSVGKAQSHEGKQNDG